MEAACTAHFFQHYKPRSLTHYSRFGIGNDEAVHLFRFLRVLSHYKNKLDEFVKYHCLFVK